MYYVKCERINALEKAIANNGDISYAYYSPGFGQVVHQSKMDEYSGHRTKSEAKKISRKVSSNYKTTIIQS